MSHEPDIQFKQQRTSPGEFGFDDGSSVIPVVDFDYSAIDLEYTEKDSTEISRDDLARIAIRAKNIFENHFLKLITAGNTNAQDIGRCVLMYQHWKDPVTLKWLGNKMGVTEARASQLFSDFKRRNEKDLRWLRSIDKRLS